MNIKTLITMTAAGLSLAACHFGTFHVVGTALDVADGDTLLLTSDLALGKPSDTILVKGGRFEITGPADSARMLMVYRAAAPDINATFFSQPGSVDLLLSATPGGSRTGGTLMNDEWQSLQDSVLVIGKAINRIAERIYGHPASMQQEQLGMKEIERLNGQFAQLLVRTAERNSDNEFGYFLLTYYDDGIIPLKERQRLARMLPEPLQQREAIQMLLNQKEE